MAKTIRCKIFGCNYELLHKNIQDEVKKLVCNVCKEILSYCKRCKGYKCACVWR